MTMKRLLVGLCLLAATAACRPAELRASDSSPAQLLSVEEAARDAGAAGPDRLAHLAALRWLVTGDLDGTRADIDRSRAQGTSPALADFVELFVAREELRESDAVDAAIRLIERHPDSPYAEVAAGRLQEFARISPVIDRRIDESLSGLERSALRMNGYATFRARSSLLAVREGRQDDAGARRVRQAMGLVTAWTVVGPFDGRRLLTTHWRSPMDPKTPLRESYEGARGAVHPRVMAVPNGVLPLDSDDRGADRYEAFADVEVREAADHLVAFAGLGEAAVFVDEVPVLVRTAYPRRAPDRSWGAVHLSAGRHRLRVTFARVDGTSVSIALPRLDGAPAHIDVSAPKVGEPVPVANARRIELPWSAAALLARRDAKAPDLVTAWARLLAAVADDPETARGLFRELSRDLPESPSLRALKIDLTSWDPELPQDAIVQVEARESAAIVAKQPGWARALLLILLRQQEDDRFDEAQRTWEMLAATVGGSPLAKARIEVLGARLALSRGDDDGARRAADRALMLDPGRCDAADLRFSMARRDDEVARTDALVELIGACKGGDAVLVSHWRSRGRNDKAREALERLVSREPWSVAPRISLSEALLADGESARAMGTLEELAAIWPDRADVQRQVSQLYDEAGDSMAARQRRAKARSIDGADLAWARLVALDEGEELLDWAARDGTGVVREFMTSHFTSSASAIIVLDAGGLELQPDGSLLERVQQIVRVQDKQAIDRFGEIELPARAIPIYVRAIKPDGRVREGESIEGKSSISIPGLQPGDFVETTYLKATPRRSAAMPGFQGGRFLFEAYGIPVIESVQTVRVPADVKLEWDAKNLGAVGEPVRKGGFLEWTHQRRQDQPLVREPGGPREAEVLPWAEVGSGSGMDTSVAGLGEWSALAGRPSSSIDAFVAGVKPLEPAERVRELVRRIGQAIDGDESEPGDASFAGPAATLARGNGSRLVLLKAALEASGIKSHVVVARPFHELDHEPRFPHLEAWSKWLLRVEPAGAAPIWIDFSVESMPPGLLPVALSELDAWVVPLPGERPERIRLPKVPEWQDRVDDRFVLKVREDGSIDGELRRTSHGAPAVADRQALERLPRDQVRKSEEQRLALVLGGVVLESVEPVASDKPDVMTVVERFRVPATGEVRLPASFLSDRLARRLLGRGARRTPLIVAAAEASNVEVVVELPQGVSGEPVAPVSVDGPFGRYEASWLSAQGSLVLKESMMLRRQRVEPERYPEFARFVVGVDQARSRGIQLGRGGERGGRVSVRAHEKDRTAAGAFGVRGPSRLDRCGSGSG